MLHLLSFLLRCDAGFGGKLPRTCRNLTFLEVKAILPREISPILKKLYEEKHIASCRKHLLALEKLAYSHSVADETFEGARDDLYASWSAVMKELEPLLQEKPGCYVYSEKLKRYVPAKFITASYYMDDPAFLSDEQDDGQEEDVCSVCAGQSPKCSDCVQWERAKEIGIRSFSGTNLTLFPNYYAVQPILCFEIEETEELAHVLLQQVTFNSNDKSDYCKFMRKEDAVKIKIALAVDILKELQYWMGDITLTLKAFGAAFEQLMEQERAHISPAFATAVTNILECVQSGVKTRNLTGLRPVPPFELTTL